MRLTALSTPGATILPQISDLFHQQSWQIRELTQEAGRLDEVFRSLTTETSVEEGGRA